nr:hypothetical protein CFP56_41256 [Quercus suber]
MMLPIALMRGQGCRSVGERSLHGIQYAYAGLSASLWCPKSCCLADDMRGIRLLVGHGDFHHGANPPSRVTTWNCRELGPYTSHIALPQELKSPIQPGQHRIGFVLRGLCSGPGAARSPTRSRSPLQAS